MIDLTKKKILVTGGAGFLGSHVVDRLVQIGCNFIFTPRSKTHDLRDASIVRDIYFEYAPDIVINIAASAGGIGACSINPAKFLYDNLIMGLNLLEEGRRSGIEKFVQIGSVCAYPSEVLTPMSEDDLWEGYPERTNASYGIAKRVLSTACQSYRQQYSMNAISLIPVNLYGPRDDFDPATSHVIPALIRKFVLPKTDIVSIWGTGKVSREFLYVEDCARAIVLATQRYDKPEPVNLGTGEEILIKDLVELIRKQVGFKGTIEFDASKPDGQKRRFFDVQRAKDEFGFKANVNLKTGLKKTIDWYYETQEIFK